MYKFLLIEDSKRDADTCKDTIKRMNMQVTTTEYEVVVSETFNEALLELKNEYHGVIVDIKLDGDHSGNEIIREIINEYRVPVVVMTGTPDTELEENSPIQIYKKGEHTYEEIIISLVRISSTGLFNVLGGKGIIEKAMNRIFWKNLYPQTRLWEDQKEKDIDTEKILLRYAITHIQELIDNELPAYLTEEMYITPPMNNQIKTGSIVKSKNDNMYCIVLSPPCDLAVHGGKMKTDRILLCEIDNFDEVNSKVIENITKKEKKEKSIANALKNAYTEYYHCLPRNTLFEGGYVNFRSALTYSPDQLAEEFNNPIIKVQEFFVKSILSRFSSYYARQGQPDFDFAAEATIVIEKMSQQVVS